MLSKNCSGGLPVLGLGIGSGRYREFHVMACFSCNALILTETLMTIRVQSLWPGQDMHEHSWCAEALESQNVHMSKMENLALVIDGMYFYQCINTLISLFKQFKTCKEDSNLRGAFFKWEAKKMLPPMKRCIDNTTNAPLPYCRHI